MNRKQALKKMAGAVVALNVQYRSLAEDDACLLLN